MTAFLGLVGTESEDRKRLMMERISDPTIWDTSFGNLVGMMSDWQADKLRVCILQWAISC